MAPPAQGNTPRSEAGRASVRRNLGQQFDDAVPESSTSRPQLPESSREEGKRLIIESEKYKAGLAAPKGIAIDQNLKLLRQFDNDDDFFHVTCHVDNALKQKIQNGEYIELERLLPKPSGGIESTDDGEVLELVSRGGQTYFAPARDRAKISNVCKWDQAFRVYAAIYSEANPNRSTEIWQYIYVIHKAASVYNWDNVSFYDHTFRHLMASKPWRSWSKTYVQAWNLAMNEPIAKNNFNTGKSSGNLQRDVDHDWRDDCCWKYNRNKCRRSNCHYDHRCTYCGGWNHGFHNCRKRLRNSGGSGKTSNNGMGSSSSSGNPAKHYHQKKSDNNNNNHQNK